MMKAEKIANLGKGSWRRYRSTEESFVELLPILFEMKTSAFSGRSCFAVLFQVFLSYAQLAAVIACIAMSSLRLKKQDYVDPIYQHSDDHKNIRWSLNIFYGLALSQCIIYFLTGILANPLRRIYMVCRTYDLGLWGVPALTRYVQECLLKCVNGDLRGVVNMDMVTFAKELSNSESLEDQLVGLRILDFLLRNKEYKGKVLKKIRASSDTVEKAVYMLGLKIDVDEDTRGHAGRILLELAEDLQIERYPGILQSISSLFSVSANKKSSGGGSNNPVFVEKEFTLLGVDILEKLVHDPDNCAQMKDAENLLFQIIGLINCCEDSEASDIDKKIVENSLKLLHKLVSTAGKTGEELRCQVSKNVHIIPNIRKILIDNAESQPQLLVQAVGILACLALDDTARKEIGQKCQIIRKLVCLLAGEIEAGQDYPIRTLAAEALVLLGAPVQGKHVLSTVSERVQAILGETTLEDMKRIVIVLSDESAEHRTVVAKLLQNLRTYQGPEYADQLKIIDQELPRVLEAIRVAVEKIEMGSSNEYSAHEMEELRNGQGILLESFIGLSLQICTSSEGDEFDNALKSVNIKTDMLVVNFKKILDIYSPPTVDYPGIRRVVVQQLNWMVLRDEKYLSVFLKHGMDKTLKMVKVTASKLEDFWLFRSGIGAFEHGVPIYSLVNKSPILQARASA
ncbi:unnamed protein product [Urochloa decumbens]|uniref:ARM repeat superfamily protein n=1 Tax=Urochloa decumbens TaxID=240449 RepID=A0ABC8YCQ5_9POAL